MTDMPAVSLVAAPGRRMWAVQRAVDIETRGFSGIHIPSLGGEQLSFCVSVADATSTIELATSIQPIYFRPAWDVAQTAGYLHEVSGGRFRLGLGVSHDPVYRRLGLDTGKPLSDMRTYVGRLRDSAGAAGGLPPITLATLRDKMLGLSVELSEGAVWANAARSHMPGQVARIPLERRDQGFFVGNMIPTVIDEDRTAAAAVHRRTLTGYVALPNYRNYWSEAGYADEMAAIAKALDAGDHESIPGLMTDRWLADVTLSGSASEVRDGVEAWQAAGVSTPILAMSSTSGGQRKALEELFAAYE